MPIGGVLNRCSCTYIDHLLQHNSLHREKSNVYVFQRLIVVCSRASNSVCRHAARILLSPFGFDVVRATSKKFIDENEAIGLMATITSYACEEYFSRSGIEIRGAQKLFNAISEHLGDVLMRVDQEYTFPLLKLFIKKVVSHFYPRQSLAFLNKLVSNSVVRRILHPLFDNNFVEVAGLSGIEFVTEYQDLYASILKSQFQPQTLIEIVSNFLAGDKKVHFSDKPDPLKLTQYLVQSTTDRSAEVIQALAFLLYTRTKCREIETEYEVLENSMDNMTSTGIGNGRVFITPVKDAIAEANRETIVRQLEISGTLTTRSVEAFTKELLSCTVQKNLVTNVSVGAAFMYQVVTTGEMAESFERGKANGTIHQDAEDPLLYWDGTNFVRAINEYVIFQDKADVTKIDWAEAFKELDSLEFFCHWKTLRYLDQVFRAAYEPADFPVKIFYTPWKHAEGQVSFFQCCLENPHILNFARYPHTKVVSPAHNLKQLPDDNDQVVQMWNCLEMSSVLLNCTGKEADWQNVIKRIFEYGYEHCPDVVMLALLQANASWSGVRIELIRSFLPGFIMQNTNVVPVLNYAWSDSQLLKPMRPLIVAAFASLYVQDDSQKLAKILDVAHELKPSGLSEVLSLPPKHINFVVELACLASKRDYLKIEKWLEDKEKAHGEIVVSTVLSYIQKKYVKQQLLAALTNQPGANSGSNADPIGMLLAFVDSKATKQLKKQFSVIFQVMKENSGRSSSVSSAGGRNSVQIGPAVFGSGPPPPVSAPVQQEQRPAGSIQPPRGVPFPVGQVPVPNFGAPGQPAHMMNQPPPQTQPSNPNMNVLLNIAPFGNTRELLKTVQPAPPTPSSMSPTHSNASNPMRPQIPPLTQRQNSSGGWHNAPTPPTNRAPGPATPSHMDFRQLPPVQDFVPQQRPIGTIGTIGSNIQNANQSTLQNSIGGEELSAQVQFSEDIQEEANTYFEKIYSVNNSMTVNDLINMLKQYKNSSNVREQKLLACVVKNLFEEYRFFHEYPERELRTTAAVYGGIIREGIIGNVQFATAVRKVIESLNADTNSMLWTFGIVALQYCRIKLCAYPKVCTMISNSDNFSKFPQNLKDYVLAGIKGELPADAGRSTPTSTTNWGAAVARAASVDPKTSLPVNRTGNSVLSYTNVDTLITATEKEGAEIAQPAEAIVDKISFLFNNLSQNNLTQKKDEVVALMKEQGDGFTKWLSQYIVMKRVSIEANFQPLYNQFVQAINNPYLDVCIKKETFRNIKILLRADKRTTTALSTYSDRQLLKNLGMWLGSITIARSRPILLNELDLKSLLLEAYYKGQAELLFVVPFISKILLSCGKTNLFTPTCAWIRSILKVMAELHNEPDLKINLKFEIEVLCKELNVDLNKLPSEGVLKDTEKLVRVPQQLCDVKVLSRPDVPSPVPSQLRLTGSADNFAGPLSVALDTKPSTPQPENINDLGPAANVVEAPVVPNVTHFAYHDISVISYDGLSPHIKINSSIHLFQLHPHVKHLVRPAMIHAIKELIGPVSERALKIAVTVTESMIRKDFAMDPDEKNMKLASFHMMRAMTAGMAMITCRDPLASTMVGNLTQSFTNSFRSAQGNISPELKVMIDEAAQKTTQDNVELATNFIVKTACEKATSEIEKRLDAEFQKRINAKASNETYRDEATMSIQKKLPGPIAIPPGSIEKGNFAIYEQFCSRICGFKPTVESGNGETAAETGVVSTAPQMKEMDSITASMQHFVKEVDSTTQAQPHIHNSAFQAVVMIRELLSNVINTRDPISLVSLITRSVEHLLHSYHLEANNKNLLDVEWTRRLRDLFIGVMRLMQSHFSPVDLSRRVTTAVINIRSDYKWNMEGIEILLKQNLIQTALWDQHLSASMDNGGNIEATLFAQKFVRCLGGSDLQKLNMLREKFPLTYDQLSKMHNMQSATRTEATNGSSGNASAQPQMPQGPSSTAGSASSQAASAGAAFPAEAAALPAGAAEAMAQRGLDDQDMTVKVELILREWIALCYTPTGQRNPQEALSQMIQLMHEQGVLATDDKITQFFRLCVEMCVDVSVRMLKPETMGQGVQSFIRHRCYYTLDAFVKLMALMIRHSDNGQSQNKINLLKKLLNIVVGVLHMDHEVRRSEFNAMPYHRILISLFNEITGPDPQRLLEPIAWSILEAFGQTFFALQPRRMPGFAFAWLDIVGHRNVIGRLLANTGIAETVDPVKTAATYTQLIISHLKFLAPFLRNIQLPKSIAILYKGTLRVLLVILHDFPELLCEFHYVICDTIPPNCVQLRNLVLSAYPRNMRLPDPFALNFKQVDSIVEMSVEPKSNLNMATIIPESIRIPLDDYLLNRESVEFLPSLPALLQSQNVPGSRYNTTVMNALVLYVGIKAIERLHATRQRISIHTIAHTSFMDIFQNLAVQLCTEGRYLLFNGIANQLRYPNAHTHYFSCVFLFLFRNSDNDAIQEQITRILFERLVALRPHPWGLLITFIELIKNPTYNFWKYEFTRCAPEIERLFQNVANTCVPSQSAANAAAAAAAGGSTVASAVAAGTSSSSEPRN